VANVFFGLAALLGCGFVIVIVLSVLGRNSAEQTISHAFAEHRARDSTRR
jgi:hypothetical protein